MQGYVPASKDDLTHDEIMPPPGKDDWHTCLLCNAWWLQHHEYSKGHIRNIAARKAKRRGETRTVTDIQDTSELPLLPSQAPPTATERTSEAACDDILQKEDGQLGVLPDL